MNCDWIRERFADYLAGDLDEKTLAEVQAHLAACSSCREELEGLSAIWTKLGVIPQEQPSPNFRQRFYSMLEAYKEGMEREKPRPGLGETVSRWITRLLPRRPAYQLALSLALLAAGLGAGYWASNRRPAVKKEIAGLQQEVNEMHGLIAASLLKQPSPSDRLMGLSWSSKISSPDKNVLQTLLETLNTDPNVNVRLAAVDALYLFYDQPQVKEGLIHSLAEQTSPIVQLSLINLLVEIRERRAADALRQLIQNEKIHPQVKKRAELVLAQLS